MTFPVPNLDDRTFQQIVDETKRRIPVHTPEWTDHNVSEPGVALIELFAWMTESIIYRLNQVPDLMYRKFLELVGITPFPAEPATVDVTFWLSTTEAPETTIPAGIEVATLQTEERDAVLFRTGRDAVARQPELKQCVVFNANTETYTEALRTLRRPSRGVVAFPSRRAGDCVYFGFAKPLPGNVIFVGIETAIHGVGVEPNNPPVAYEVSVTSGEQPWAAAELDDQDGDTTGGLNTNGRILLHFPYDHGAAVVDGIKAYWLRLRLTEAAEGQATYVESPRVQTASFRSVGVRAPAVQGELMGREVIGFSDGQPGQEFRVRTFPVLDRIDGETVEVKAGDAEPVAWEEVPHFGYSEANDKHFTWDSTSGLIRFGPAVTYREEEVQHGAIPADGAEIAVTRYRHGGGRVGNVPRDSIVVLKSSLPFVARIQNRKKATGGIDPETIENAKVRGPLDLVTGDRAIATQDYERLALHNFRWLARARCRPVEKQGDPIHLFLVRDADVSPWEATVADFLPTADQLDDIQAFLDERRVLGTLLVIGPPTYHAVSVTAKITVKYGQHPPTVREECRRRLYEYINPVTGGPEADGFPWGAELRRRELVSVLGSVPGVHRVEGLFLFDADYDPATGYTESTRSGAGVDAIQLESYEQIVSADHYVLVHGTESLLTNG